MRCKRCKTEVSRVESKNAHEERDGSRIVGVWHAKCWYVSEKEKRIGGRYHAESPTAYDMRQGAGRKTREDLTDEELRRRAEAQYVVLQARQREIAEQRQLEDQEQGFADWRDPEELELEELLEAVEDLAAEAEAGYDLSKAKRQRVGEEVVVRSVSEGEGMIPHESRQTQDGAEAENRPHIEGS